MKSLAIMKSTIGSVDEVGRGSFSSAQILRRTQLWRHKIEHVANKKQRFIGLAVPPSADFFSALLGIWQSGSCAVLLEAGLRPPERQAICKFIPLDLVLCGSDVDWPCMTITPPTAKYEPGVDGLEFSPERPALALLTSGTTGVPKIVILSFGALAARIETNIATIGTKPLQRTLQILSLTFGHGLIGSALTTLLSGGVLVLPQQDPRRAMRLGAIIDDLNISFLTAVPAFWRMVIRVSPPPSSQSLLRVNVGSAPLDAELWKAISAWSGCPVYNCYGMTETANWVSFSSFEDGAHDGLVGQCLDSQFRIVPSPDQVSDPGMGEVWVKTSGMMEGYLHSPDLTASVITNGWFRTGDIGQLDENGRLTLIGRKKEIINCAGAKVVPDEVDRLLERHPAIAEACTFGLPDKISGDSVAVALVRVQGHAVTKDELSMWCSQLARRELVPDHWFFVDSVCRNERGKLDRQRQRKMLTGDS